MSASESWKLSEDTSAPFAGEEPGSVESTQYYLQEIGKLDLLTNSKEQELARLVRDGDKQAKAGMIEANLRLVVGIAKKYDGSGIPLLDLIQEGNIGLMYAIEKFDIDKGFKLSTWAVHCIHSAIRDAIPRQAGTITVPKDERGNIGRMLTASKRLALELGRDPTDEELADALDIKPSTLGRIQRSQRLQHPISIEEPVGSRPRRTLGDLIEDEGGENPEVSIPEESFKVSLHELLEKILTDREMAIITARFGLDGSRPSTLEEVGREFAVTRERIRQIEAKAFAKLRERSDVNQLREDLD